MDAKLTYGNNLQTLWEFADIEISFMHSIESMTVVIPDNENKRKINKVIEALNDIQGSMIQSGEKINTR